jgi:hypothetical protein
MLIQTEHVKSLYYYLTTFIKVTLLQVLTFIFLLRMERPVVLSLLQPAQRVSPGIADKRCNTNLGAICHHHKNRIRTNCDSLTRRKQTHESKEPA